MAVDAAVHEHVACVGFDVVEDESEVGDDEPRLGALAPEVLLQNLVDGLPEDFEILQVNPDSGSSRRTSCGSCKSS